MFAWFENRVSPFPKIPQTPYPQNVFAFIYACTSGVRSYLVLLAILTAFVAIFEAILFQFLSQVIDYLKNQSPSSFWNQHAQAILTMGGLLLASPLLLWFQSLVQHQTLMGNFPMRLRWIFHQQMLRQSMHFYQNEFAGRVSSKVLQTALAVREVIMVCVNMLVYILIYFASILFVVGSFNSWMMLPFFAWMLLFIGMNCYFVPKLSQVSQDQASARAIMTGRITDAYTNISTIKLFSQGHAESEYAKSAMQDFLTPVHGQMRLVTLFVTVDFALSTWTILSTGVLALYLWSINVIDIGAVAASIAFALRLNGISRWIMWEMSRLFENIGAVKDGITTITQPLPIQDNPEAPSIYIPSGKIDFQDVAFHYHAHQTIFQNFQLSIRAGEKIGIVGPSGAGKSTLIHLLLRFYDPQAGRILIDGQNIADYNQESLRSHIGVVSQDTSLLHRSIFENIAYGRPNASIEEVIAAAKKAHAHTFIEQLIDKNGQTGYEVMVGERGLKLSGGQRQRIAIARVMLKNAPILVLDEATSALDSEVEQAIQESFTQLMENKTVLAIAHRLSTIAAMDRLIVLHEGQLIEQGSHAELLDKNGMYARLWHRQSGGFIADAV